MTVYDSDSSLDEEAEFTETNVTLGFASKEPAGNINSHLGGFPVRHTMVERELL